jgi:single-stranded-DNA-specific exonuclease
MTRDPVLAESLASHLEELNSRRQAMEREITGQALQQVREQPDFGTARSLVVSGDWNPGLIGLTAGKLCEKFYLPAVALSLQGDTAVGSCRSIPGVHIFGMLQRCGDLLTRFGGHAQAAGLTLPAGNIAAFRERLSRVISESCPPEVFRREMAYDLEVPFRSWDEESLGLLEQLEPTGEGNPAPVFLLSGASVQTMRRVGRDLSHLQVTLLDRDNTPVRGIAFSQGEEADRPRDGADLFYRPYLNEFRGRRSVEARIFALR